MAQVVYVVINAGPEHRKGLTYGPEAPDDSYHSTEADKYSFASGSTTGMLVASCKKVYRSQSSTSLHSSRPVKFSQSNWSTANSAFQHLRFVKTFRESDGPGFFLHPHFLVRHSMKVGLQGRGCEDRERCSTRFTHEVSLGLRRRLDVGLTISIAHFREEEITRGRHLSCITGVLKISRGERQNGSVTSGVLRTWLRSWSEDESLSTTLFRTNLGPIPAELVHLFRYVCIVT